MQNNVALSSWALGALFFLVPVLLSSQEPKTNRTAQPTVLAFYYGWHVSQESWCLPGGNKRKAPHNPLLGDYISSDPKVIQQHLEWARQAGIDVLIFSWWGKDRARNKPLELLLKEAGRQNNGTKVCVYYETVLTPREEQELNRAKGPNRAKVRGSFDVASRVVEDMRYLVEEYGSSPAFFRVDGKPVVFIYNRAVVQASGFWKEIVSRIRKTHDVFLNVEGPIIPALQQELFDLVDAHHFYAPLHLSAGISEGVKDTPERRRMREGALRLIEKARKSGRTIALPVAPGCDTSLCYPDKDPVMIKRENGDHYRKVWNETVALKPDWITIVSFNEWPEGTEIEPSREWGELYLKLTKEYAERFKQQARRSQNQ